MKKAALIILLAILSINLISAIEIDVTTKTVSGTAITDLDEPAVFDITIRNLGEDDSFEIYSLVGIDITPENPYAISSGQTRTIRINAFPSDSLKSRKGSYPFEYKIRSSKNEIYIGNLNINIAGLGDVIQIIPENINPESETESVQIRNKASVDFSELEIKMTSVFFDYQDSISIKGMETKELQVPIDIEKMRTLDSGNYLLNSKIKTRGVSAEVESMIKFLEQENIETTETNEGIIFLRREIIKRNFGNVKKTVEITAEKDLISYLFTTVNIEPSETSFQGFHVEYSWKKELIPNEEIDVVIKTNWIFPIVIVILIIFIVYFIKRTVETDLKLEKKVSFVKTRGGQFALKVTLHLNARRFIERINVFDKLPPLVKLYDKFGAIHPNKIDINNRRIEWNVDSLNADEERIFTYIIYSRIGVVGKFELPSAKATYEKEGKIKRSTSNRSFFINEPKSV